MHATGYWPRPYDSARGEYDARGEYEGLRQEYEALRRPFNPIPEGDVWTSVITANTDTDIIHPTQKPLWLVKRCIECSSNPGDIILDPFMGSGTTAVAAVQTGRHYIGFEKDPGYYEKLTDRVKKATKVKRATRTLDDFF